MKKDTDGLAMPDQLNEELCCQFVGPNLEPRIRKVVYTEDIIF